MEDNVAGAQQIAEDIYGFISENIFITDGPARSRSLRRPVPGI